MTADSSELKKNELDFQNRKYAKSPTEKAAQETSVNELESRLLTPIHQGGHPRGLLFKRTVQRLMEHDVRGKRILDYCCGRGDLGIYLAMKDALVSGFDFSEKAIEIARRRAAINHVEVDFQLMDAEELSYPADHFDYIIGFEALHHVILHPRVPSELARVVREKGKVFFAENWGGNNPFFQLWREKTTLSRNRSADRGEVILCKDQIHARLSSHFSCITVEPLSLFYMSKKYLKSRSLLSMLLAMDNTLIKTIPALRNYCGEAIITLTV